MAEYYKYDKPCIPPIHDDYEDLRDNEYSWEGSTIKHFQE